MKTSESIIKLMPDLVKAQSAIKAVVRDAENPHFRSTYADLSSLIEAIKEPLNSNKITVLQPIDGDVVETVFIHETGEWISDGGVKIILKDPTNPQSQGSAITYAKRYGLMSFFAIPTEDDDGNAASEPPRAFGKRVDTPQQAHEMTEEFPLKKRCRVHTNDVMTRKDGRDGGYFYSHKLADGSWCNGGNS